MSPVTTLIIARHGNTFSPDETPRRVGARTDLPLVSSGHTQAKKLGHYLHDHSLLPDRVYTSRLKRTKQTADIALTSVAHDVPVSALPVFDEIDYGPDENREEPDVVARIGEAALRDWEQDGIMPQGWSPDAATIRRNWTDFALQMIRLHEGEKIMVVTSNGIARFALHLMPDWTSAKQEAGLKLSTGAFGLLTHRKDALHWSLAGWNIRP